MPPFRAQPRVPVAAPPPLHRDRRAVPEGRQKLLPSVSPLEFPQSVLFPRAVEAAEEEEEAV
ncbi:hypothetical protein T281_11950 [Rhodomicrobium udaipurense JA643]|nr:hypothetical protein T281_11950 [Rhodomicrobium udaipurense JA643]